MRQALKYIGFSLVTLATVLGILYSIDSTNAHIGNIFYKSGRDGISHLSSLDAAHDNRTLDKNNKDQKNSYEVLIKILKKNQPEMNYKVMRAIESKAIAKYAPTVTVDSKVIQLFSPPISLLGEKSEQDEAVTNLDTFKIWYSADEASSFFLWVLSIFLIGTLAQFFSGSDLNFKRQIKIDGDAKRWLLVFICLTIVTVRIVWPALRIDEISIWFLLFAGLLFAMPELKGLIKKIKFGDAEIELDTKADNPDITKKIIESIPLKKDGEVIDKKDKKNTEEEFHIYVAAGLEYERVNRFDLAIQTYEKALTMKPDDIGLHLRLGVIYGERLGDKESKRKAIDHCKAAVGIEESNISANFNLAVYTNHLEGAEKSLTIYQKCQRLIKEQGLNESELDGKLHLFLGHDYLHLRQVDLARRYYEKAIAIMRRLADAGDKTSQFWLNDAERHLSNLNSC